MHLPLRETRGASPRHSFSRRSKLVFFVASFLLISATICYLPFENRMYMNHLLISPTRYTWCKLEEPEARSCSANAAARHEPIPNNAHYVFILRDPAGDFPFQFSHFLNIYSAHYLWKPDNIYIHTNVAPDSSAVDRARSGETGKWNRLIFNLPNIVINQVEVPTHAGNGVEIKGLEHLSDFVRVKAVHQFGGTYIDFDVFPLRDLKPLRERGFAAVGGRQAGGELNSGTFMASPGSAALAAWMDEMNRVYDGHWATHSNGALTTVGDRMVGQPCELLALRQDAFAPFSWLPHDVKDLFYTHEGEPMLPPGSTNSTLRKGVPLTEEHIPEDFDSDKSQMPSWARDYTCTYLLHAFNGNKARNGIKHNGIDPRYVLDLRSNFARAVYPIAKMLYDGKVITLNDTDLGT